uniref:HIT family protein n=1 Tax=Vaginimicrobium propionicum TaxID=1871034 RepID=UPI00097047AF|nr:HIT domain-containing protein [Vaginimicrobium propionicum]
MSEDCQDGLHFAGVPDEFQRLWVPYRMAYIDGDSKPSDSSEKECPFCQVPAKSDDAGLVVRRGEHAYVVLNLFPYNTGHLLVCPYRHVADYIQLTTEETREIAVLTQESIRTLQAVSKPQGFNLGMNQGSVAGAGIAAHLHQHVIPRWLGDANFFPLIAKTKALPQLLCDTRTMLANAWVS